MNHRELEQRYHQELKEFIKEADDKPGFLLRQDPNLGDKITRTKDAYRDLKQGQGRSITMVFMGRGGFMQRSALGTLEKMGLKVIGGDYNQDEDIQYFTVKGPEKTIVNARQQLERSEFFGGVLNPKDLGLNTDESLSEVRGEFVKLGEAVAGPKSCWPGHRKIGTQPGTGKNAGKRVNKCKKIKEETLEETAPQMPDVQGLRPGESRDLGSGTRVTVNTDGTVTLSGGFGQYVYDQSGRVIKQQSPTMGGFSQEHDSVTGQSKTHYRKGPMSVSQDSQGKASAEYTLGSEKFTASNENAESGTRSTISGDEDHDEMSKLLVQRLRRLAGL